MKLKTNIDTFLVALPDPMEMVKDDLRVRLRHTTKLIHDGLTSRTPVWQGTTLVNYKWSMDAPDQSGPLRARGSGDPGPTNSMAIGTEPRRGANQAVVDASYKSLQFSDPFRVFYITNNAPNIMRVEFGTAPDADNSRAPNGVFRVTAASVEARLRAER